MSNLCRIGVGKDLGNWHDGFLRGLEASRGNWDGFSVELIDIDRSDWLDVVREFDVIVWKPALMGEGGAAQFRAKVHFMQTMLGKLVIPNVATSWHFENKAAQSHIFELHGVPTPRTIVANDPAEALRHLGDARFPLVFKQPHGAGSDHVFKVENRAQAEIAIRKCFSRIIWHQMKTAGVGPLGRAWRAASEGWLYEVLRSRFNDESPWQTVYWQEFVPNNASDLRVTVIGNDVVFAFRRGNRPGDFRASGSGRLMYGDQPSTEILNYCLGLSRRMNFDSMAYDLLFDEDGKFVITEMSYGYNDKAMYDTPGHHRRMDDGTLVWEEGHRWPQDLWGEWVARRARTWWEARKSSAPSAEQSA